MIFSSMSKGKANFKDADLVNSDPDGATSKKQSVQDRPPTPRDQEIIVERKYSDLKSLINKSISKECTCALIMMIGNEDLAPFPVSQALRNFMQIDRVDVVDSVARG